MSNSIKTLQGSVRLAFDAAEGITTIVERMHETIARRPLPLARQPAEPGKAHGLIASSVYSMIRGINNAIREGVDWSFAAVPGSSSTHPVSDAEIRMVAALNGAFGDHLEATGNALATPMRIITSDGALDLDPAALRASLPDATPHVVVLIHGLSLSERSWNRRDADSMGERLQRELGFTPLYLRYNSGRHISTNGQELSELLDQLSAAWPVPIESLSLIGHSMGGLISRSAGWYAAQTQSPWLDHLQRVVCLGTPHHGSPLEKAGHAFDLAMQRLPYTAPLAVGKGRSAGIKDLHHGDLLDEDWQGQHPDRPRRDNRRPVPLLPDVDYYFAAATLGRDRQDPLGHLLGDLLVRLDSAVGSHRDDLRQLDIPPDHCRVFHEKNHFDLLDDAQVHQQVVDWFSEA